MAATMHDVARRAQVSVKTVSNVLNGYRYIRPETRERVEEAISALEYRVNSAARSLRSGRSRTVVLAIPELSQPYFAELAQALIDEAAAIGLTVFVQTTGGQLQREQEVLSGDWPVTADALIFSPSVTSAVDAAATSPPVPMVLLGERIFRSRFDHVTMANAAAAEAATGHLLGSGRRRVLVVGASLDDTTTWTGSLRLQGALDAHRARGVDVAPELVVAPHEWSRDGGQRVVERVLDDGVAFDAVFAMNDVLALGAMRGLLRAGLSVPGDVAVVGFDDTAEARFSTPPLTSIAPGRPEIARLCIELLASRLEGTRPPEEHVELVSSFSLVVRESS